MNKLTKRIMFVLFIVLSFSALQTKVVFANNSGAIWTTDSTCGGSQQDINHYYTGSTVYINGSNFDADVYSWSIEGQPGQASSAPGVTIAGGSVTVGEDGNFCFPAHSISSSDWGEFKVSFSNKGDNYRANSKPIVVPTSTFTPTVSETSTPTETATPTSTFTPTLPPTESPEPQPTRPTTGTPEPQPTIPPSETPVATATTAPTPTQTSVPVQTETTDPTQMATIPPTQAPQQAPVTGSPANPALLQGGAAVLALISLGTYALLKKKAD